MESTPHSRPRVTPLGWLFETTHSSAEGKQMISSTKTRTAECDDLCARDRRITTTLLVLLMVTCALPALVFHGGNGSILTDNQAVTFLRSVMQPHHPALLDDL
jgi:hypothetical protein